MVVVNRNDSRPFTTKDGSEVRSILDTSNAPVRNQSLAEATLPPGESTDGHRHRTAAGRGTGKGADVSTIRAEVTIHGRVQGVGFRYATVEQAERLGLTGWVRNTWEDTVEACFEGDEPDVKEMVDWCRRGPMMARVERLDVDYGDATGEFAGFRVTG
jgi:acylphosphatase